MAPPQARRDASSGRWRRISGPGRWLRTPPGPPRQRPDRRRGRSPSRPPLRHGGPSRRGSRGCGAAGGQCRPAHTTASRNTAWIASGRPFRPSTTTSSTSPTPRLHGSRCGCCRQRLRPRGDGPSRRPAPAPAGASLSPPGKPPCRKAAAASVPESNWSSNSSEMVGAFLRAMGEFPPFPHDRQQTEIPTVPIWQEVGELLDPVSPTECANYTPNLAPLPRERSLA